MEDLAKPVALNHEMVETLDQIRAGAENALHGANPAQAEELFKKHLAPMVVGSGMPVLQVMHYQWFLRELARLWRTRKGRDLAFHLELTIRKWVNLGLEPRTIQFLICEAHQRLKASQQLTANSLPPTAESAEPADVRSGRDPSSASGRHSVSSAESVDVRSLETAKDAKTAKSGPDSDTGPLDSSNPGPLSSSTPGALS